MSDRYHERDRETASDSTLLVDQLAAKTDDELAGWIRGCELGYEHHLAEGKDFGAWWYSKLLSAALVEERRRRGEAV